MTEYLPSLLHLHSYLFQRQSLRNLLINPITHLHLLNSNKGIMTVLLMTARKPLLLILNMQIRMIVELIPI